MRSIEMKTATSRIGLAVALAVIVSTGIAAPALADVEVTVSVDKDKTIDVRERILIDKDVDIDIVVELVGLGAAEAQALANVDNTRNRQILKGVLYEAKLIGSMSNNIGITQFNQAAGNMQNQGNIVAAAIANTGDAFVNSQAEVDQQNGGVEQGNVVDASNSTFLASIGPGSLSGNSGITQFNQDAGNNNNQTNAIAVAAGVDGDEEDVLVALSEAALGQESSNQAVFEGSGEAGANFKSATINGALNGSTGGIIGVNQAAGNNANQGNVVSVAAFVNF